MDNDVTTIWTPSVNRPNITLKVEELSSDSSSPAAVQFAKSQQRL